MVSSRSMTGFVAGLLLWLSLNGTALAEVRAVPDLNVDRYLGTWYEIARIPMFFQRGCKNSSAVYGKISDTKISVLNACDRNGKRVTAKGDAVVRGPGKLGVSFSRFMPFRAAYWVLYIDRDYQTAVVGSPGKRYGWILSRKPQRSKSSLGPALKALKDNGYDLEKFVWN